MHCRIEIIAATENVSGRQFFVTLLTFHVIVIECLLQFCSMR